MISDDGGLSWNTEIPDFIPPQLDDPSSWKHSYVYGFDTVPGTACPKKGPFRGHPVDNKNYSVAKILQVSLLCSQKCLVCMF